MSTPPETPAREVCAKVCVSPETGDRTCALGNIILGLPDMSSSGQITQDQVNKVRAIYSMCALLRENTQIYALDPDVNGTDNI